MYCIVYFSFSVMCILVMVKPTVLLLHSACNGPEARLNKAREKSLKLRKLYSTGSEGFLHVVSGNGCYHSGANICFT